MAPRRLIPKSTVEDWEVRLHDAASAAVAEMHAHVKSTLAAHGIQLSALTAAGEGVKAWSAAVWAAAIAKHVTPVANQIATEAQSAAQDAVPADATWGMPSSAPAISATLVASVVAAGTYLGSRLNANISSATDPAQAADDVFATAGDIIGGQLGASAEMVSNWATQDVSSYLQSAMGNTYDAATKVWGTAGDDHVRPDHQDAEGQEVPINATFSVGGEDLLYPGDPDGSDEQTAGCRCFTTTTGIEPGQAIYGTPEDQDASQGLETILNRAGRQTSLPTSPRDYPN